MEDNTQKSHKILGVEVGLESFIFLYCLIWAIPVLICLFTYKDTILNQGSGWSGVGSACLLGFGIVPIIPVALLLNMFIVNEIYNRSSLSKTYILLFIVPVFLIYCGIRLDMNLWNVSKINGLEIEGLIAGLTNVVIFANKRASGYKKHLFWIIVGIFAVVILWFI